jgi:REP element-mobilizing transposase RayT
MTAPRRIVAGTLYLLTRRTLGRAFFLRPSKLANELLQYILAVAAERHGIVIHAFSVLSNHLHLVVSDPNGTLPSFERYLDSLLARSFNAMLGRWETFWAPGSYSAVALETPADVLDKIAYVLANPVAAGLVRRASEWPGLWSAPEMIGAGPVIVKRPKHFFREDGPMPETAKLELVCPPGFESVEAFREQLIAAITAREDEAAGRLASEGRSFAGAATVLAQDPLASPRTFEPRRGLNPRIASRDPWKRIEAIQRLKTFLAEYRMAWEAFTSGLRETVFPAGTYWMRVIYGVPCAASG